MFTKEKIKKIVDIAISDRDTKEKIELINLFFPPHKPEQVIREKMYFIPQKDREKIHNIEVMKYLEGLITGKMGYINESDGSIFGEIRIMIQKGIDTIDIEIFDEEKTSRKRIHNNTSIFGQGYKRGIAKALNCIKEELGIHTYNLIRDTLEIKYKEKEDREKNLKKESTQT